MIFLAKNPFIRLVIPLMMGLLLGHHFSTGWSFLVLATGILLLSLLLINWSSLRKQYFLQSIRGLIITLLFVVAGCGLIFMNRHTRPVFTQQKQTFIAEVVDIPAEKKKSLKTILRLRQRIKDTVFMKEGARLLAYFSQSGTAPPVKPGDVILVSAYVQPIKNYGNPHEFDYKTYMATHRIYHQTYLDREAWRLLKKGDPGTLKGLSNRWRLGLLRHLKASIPDKSNLAVASALILGYKELLTPTLKSRFSGSGAMHILAVSGLHVGIIYLLCHYVLLFLERYRRGKGIKTILTLLILMGYALLTGLSPSVSRATLMFSVLVIGSRLRRYSSPYNSLAFSAFLLLICNPMLLFSVSFQLSYAAVTSIVFFQPRLYRLIELPALPDRLWQWLSLALAAQIGAAPLVIHYFHIFPNYFWLSNFIAIPAATLIIILGILLLISSWAFPLITTWLANPLNLILQTLNKSTLMINHLPRSTTNLWLEPYELFFFYSLTAALAAFFIYKSSRMLKIALTLCIGLLITNSVSTYQKRRRNELIVFNTGGLSAINCVSASENILYIGETGDPDEAVRYHMKNHWLSRGLKTAEMVGVPGRKAGSNPDKLTLGHFINREGLKMAYLNRHTDLSQLDPPHCLEIDYIILAGQVRVNLEDLCRLFRFKKIILDSSIPYYPRQEWIKQLKAHGINYHSVPEQGAFRVLLS
jgi:competence protein ComEC